MTLRDCPADLVTRLESDARYPLIARRLDWERVPLAMIAQVTNGEPFSSSLFSADGPGMPLVRIRDVARGRSMTLYSGNYKPQSVIADGDLLVGMDGDFAAAVWQGGPALLNQRVCKISIIDERLYDDRFLAHVLPGYLRMLWDFTPSVTVKHLSSLSLKTLPLPLPPVAEQRRIVNQIDSAFERLQAGDSCLRQVQLRLSSLERRMVADAITGAQDVGCGSAEPPEPPAVMVRDGILPCLPATWRWARLHEIADVVGGVTKDARRQSDPAVPLVPYLRVANVQRGYLDLGEVAEIRVPDATVKKLELQVGDVLLNEGGDRDKLGRGWVWEGQIDRCIHQNHVFRARIRDGRLHPKLLAWHANGFGHWFEANGKQSVNLASISLRTIKQLPVPIPPRDDQEEIVRRVEDRLAETGLLRQVLQAAERSSSVLRKAILADAFAGRLVPQDPADEPASELLARIRAEQAQASRRRTVRARPGT